MFYDYMVQKKLPMVDMLAAHAANYAKYKIPVEDYLAQYYIGHYNPRGNFFMAFEIKDALVKMLVPKTVAYRDE